MLTDKLVDSFNGLIEFVAWVLLIVGTIIGIVIGKDIKGIWLLLCPIIGLGGTFLFEAITFPPLIILYKIYAKNIDIQNEVIEVNNNLVDFYNDTMKKNDSKTATISDSGEKAVKVCKKCGAQNLRTSVTCKDCGEYL